MLLRPLERPAQFPAPLLALLALRPALKRLRPQLVADSALARWLWPARSAPLGKSYSVALQPYAEERHGRLRPQRPQLLLWLNVWSRQCSKELLQHSLRALRLLLGQKLRLKVARHLLLQQLQRHLRLHHHRRRLYHLQHLLRPRRRLRPRSLLRLSAMF